MAEVLSGYPGRRRRQEDLLVVQVVELLLAHSQYQFALLVGELQLGVIVILVVLQSGGGQTFRQFLKMAAFTYLQKRGWVRTLMTLSVSVLKLKSPKTKYGALPYVSLWNLWRVCSRARRRFLQ